MADTLHDLFFSSSSLIEFYLRLLFAFGILSLLGALVLPRAPWNSSQRVLLGVLMTAYSLLFLSAFSLEELVSGSQVFWLLFLLGSLAFFLRRFRVSLAAYRAADGGRAPIFRSVGVLLVFSFFLLLYCSGEWPRYIPLSHDSSQHSFFLHQLLRYDHIPWSQPPLGPEPLNYPIGLSLWSFAWAKAGWGLKALEVTPMAGALSLLLAAGLIWQGLEHLKFRSRLFVLAGYFAMNWAVYYPYKAHQALGRTVIYPILVYFLLQALFGFRDRRQLPYFFVLVILSGPFFLALNPALAPLLLGVLLVVTLILLMRETSLFCRPRFLTISFFLSLGSLALVIWGDPYFYRIFLGTRALGNPLASGLPSVEWGWQMSTALKSLFSELFTNPMALFQMALGQGLSGVGLLLVFFGVYVVLLRIRRRLHLLKGVALALVFYGLGIWIFSLGFDFKGSFPPVRLLPRYTAQMASFLCWGLLLVGIGYELSALKLWPSNRARRALSMALLLIWLVGPVTSLASLLGRSFYRFEIPEPGLQSLLLELHDIWQQHPGKRVLIENEIKRPENGERWMVPEGANFLAAYLPNTNIAFFYFQASTQYTTENYKKHLCEDFNPRWLEEQGIHYILLGDREACRVCETFPKPLLEDCRLPAELEEPERYELRPVSRRVGPS